MWGQIEGEAKVTIARRVLGDLVRDWDESEPLGLVAYGHRREGDCSDIETVVPPGPVDREALLTRIGEISPKGKTPLTDAVRHAAEELKYRDVPANVVLISDGIETCNVDPCAVATELSEAGVNFTAHVIGFDVGDADQAQLACIAENTGGRFFAARDAEGLQAALTEAAEIATEEVPEPEVTITAPASAVAGANVEVSWEGEQIHPRDLVTIVPADADPHVRDQYERVGNLISATLLAPGEVGPHEARYVSSATGRAVASAPVELTEPQVTLSAPASVAGGARLTVGWDNRVHPRDYVTIVPADSPADAYDDYVRVGNNASDTLQAPAEPGDYEVRYLLTSSGSAVASTPIEVVDKTVEVTAPESVTAGTSLTVEWSDVVHPRDYVTVVEAGAPADAYTDYIRVGDDRSGSLPAPAEPGDYEVRYALQKSSQAIASTPLEVTEAETSVSAPESATAGSTVTVSWTNVIHPRDYVTIVPAGASDDAYADYKRVGGGESATLPVPAEPGQYEVRYALQKSSQAIASAPLEVTAAETSVMAPESATAGSTVTVTWTNVIHPRDYVTIVRAGASDDAYADYKRVGGGDSATLPVPAEPGDYEVRYALQKSSEAIASTPLEVTAAETSVSAPESATAGGTITVSWTNAIHPRDYVTIVPAGAPGDAYGDYKRVGGGESATLMVPAEPGEYEVRYALQKSSEAIASTPLTVSAAETAVSGPESVVAGSNFDVTWTNVIHPRDKVTIVPTGAPSDADGDYLRVGSATSGTLQAPSKPGDYEVRYLLNESGEAIASAPVAVTSPETGVSGPESAPAGSRITVEWTNTIHPRDKVAIVSAGAPDDADDEYLRTGSAFSGVLDAPAAPGDYEIRYLLEVDGRAIARAPVELTPPEVTVTAPQAVAAGERFEAGWSGSIHPRDKITIVPADAPEGEDGDYKRVGGRTSQALQAPDAPGAYEVRYLLNASGRAIARVPVVVE
jgi:Ca-activated chloride channel family protein